MADDLELSVAKNDLLKLVASVQGVAGRKRTMSDLSNVLITADAADPARGAEAIGSVRLSATDLSLAITGTIRANVSKAGSVAVPAKDLLEIVKAMPDGPIHIASSDNAATTIKAIGSARRFTLRGMPGFDFPPLPAPAEGAPSLVLEVSVLQELIAKTYFSVSKDETRAHMSSALFEWDGDVVRMVSTDGHRLSKVEVKVPGRSATATMLIPLKAIHELRRLADEMLAEGAKDEGKPQLQITQSGSSAFFQAGSTSFSVQLVDAQFPPYARVIPQNADKKIRVPRVAFADALRAASLAASERPVRVMLSLAKQTMRITSESPEGWDAFDEIPIEYGGPPMTVGFNAKFFLDVLGSLDEEEIVLLLSGEIDPAVIRPNSSRAFLAVVMPMRI